MKSDVGQVRAAIHVNRDRTGAVSSRVGGNTERLVTIKTPLEERLPERRQLPLPARRAG